MSFWIIVLKIMSTFKWGRGQLFLKNINFWLHVINIGEYDILYICKFVSCLPEWQYLCKFLNYLPEREYLHKFLNSLPEREYLHKFVSCLPEWQYLCKFLNYLPEREYLHKFLNYLPEWQYLRKISELPTWAGIFAQIRELPTYKFSNKKHSKYINQNLPEVYLQEAVC